MSDTRFEPLFDPDDYTSLFERIAQALQSDGYCIINEALPKALLDALILQIESQVKSPGEFSQAGIGQAQAEQQNADIRRDKIAWIDADTQANAAWIMWCEAIKQALNRRLFLGLFSYESHYAVYQTGDFYKRHLDAFANSTSGSERMLSMVTYLNRDWPDNAGGELVLYSQEEQCLQRVKPEAGTMVLFLSAEFPHEVLAAQQQRYSIATWFRLNNTQRVDPPR